MVLTTTPMVMAPPTTIAEVALPTLPPMVLHTRSKLQRPSNISMVEVWWWILLRARFLGIRMVEIAGF